ncbi:hypothetical protein GY21_05755 [Cryobacterium roopkundense]|nr:hypothetical protein GY21_05755 [Cryobacterium roopkundense]
MSSTASQQAQIPDLTPSGKFVRKWAAIASWILAAVLLVAIALLAPDKMDGAIGTALAIFAFGIFAATIQTSTSFWIGVFAILGGLVAAFIVSLNAEGTLPLVVTIVNAVITVVSVCWTTFGSNQQTHLS